MVVCFIIWYMSMIHMKVIKTWYIKMHMPMISYFSLIRQKTRIWEYLDMDPKDCFWSVCHFVHKKKNQLALSLFIYSKRWTRQTCIAGSQLFLCLCRVGLLTINELTEDLWPAEISRNWWSLSLFKRIIIL